jgi:hypothetical protein
MTSCAVAAMRYDGGAESYGNLFLRATTRRKQVAAQKKIKSARKAAKTQRTRKAFL